jgi:hypothetical protein
MEGAKKWFAGLVAKEVCGIEFAACARTRSDTSSAASAGRKAGGEGSTGLLGSADRRSQGGQTEHICSIGGVRIERTAFFCCSYLVSCAMEIPAHLLLLLLLLAALWIFRLHSLSFLRSPFAGPDPSCTCRPSPAAYSIAFLSSSCPGCS